VKKILLLILTVSVLFVIGCGSGGGGSTASTPTTSPGGVKTANFTLTLNEAAAPASGDSRHSLAMTPGTANMARVVIRKILTQTTTVDVCSQYDDDGNCTGTWNPTPMTTTTEIYRKVVDAPIVAASVSVEAPVSADSNDKYTFDVLTYRAATGLPNEMLKFGHDPNVVVQAGGSATITINDIVGSLVVNIPTKIVSDQAYNVTFGAANTPVRGYYELGVKLLSTGIGPTGTNDITQPVKISGGSKSLTAPHTTNQSDTQLLFTVKCFISDDMLNKGEKFTDWTRIYPDDYGITGETLASVLVPLATMTLPVN
jgi:hypothetical protein